MEAAQPPRPLQLWISQSCSWAKYIQSSLICSISPQAAHPAVWTNCLEMSSSGFIWHYLPFCLGHWFPHVLCLKTHIIHQFVTLQYWSSCTVPSLLNTSSFQPLKCPLLLLIRRPPECVSSGLSACYITACALPAFVSSQESLELFCFWKLGKIRSPSYNDSVCWRNDSCLLRAATAELSELCQPLLATSSPPQTPFANKELGLLHTLVLWLLNTESIDK